MKIIVIALTLLLFSCSTCKEESGVVVENDYTDLNLLAKYTCDPTEAGESCEHSMEQINDSTILLTLKDREGNIYTLEYLLSKEGGYVNENKINK